MRNKFGFVLVVLGAFALSACGSNPAEPTPVGNFTLTAMVSGEGNPVSGGRLTLTRSGSSVGSANTDQGGRAVFQGLGEASYKLELAKTFGFRSPVSQDVSLSSDSTVRFDLVPADSVILDCISLGDGPCLKDGDTLYWPTDELRMRGRWRGVTYPYPQIPGVGLNSISPIGNTGPEYIEINGWDDLLAKLGGRYDYAFTATEWVITSRKGYPYYPCTCGNVLAQNCTRAYCYEKERWSGAKLFSPPLDNLGNVNVIAVSDEQSFTFNLVRR